MRFTPELELVEMGRNKESSLCCGGGGGRFWTETASDERFSNMRVEEVISTGAGTLVTGCPFCILNFDDSSKAMGNEDSVQLMDIAEGL